MRIESIHKAFILSRNQILGGIAILQAAVLVMVVLPTDFPLLQHSLAVVYLTLVPGILVYTLIGSNEPPFVTKLLYVIGLSLTTIMVLGAVISLVYPLVGIEQPMTELPLALTFFALVTGLAVAIVDRDEQLSFEIALQSLFSPVPLVLLLLPFVSILGTVYYETSRSNVVLFGLLVLIAFIPVLMALYEWRSPEEFQWYTLAVWVISLALLYHAGGWLPPYMGGLRGGTVTIEQGIWLPNGSSGAGSLLPNTVLYPIYALLGDVSLGAQTAIVNPFIVSFVPLTLFEVFRRHTSPLYGFLAVCVFMFSFPFYTLYPVGGRVATPVLFIALIGLTLSDTELTPLSQSVLGIAFFASLAVSHYGTAWVALFAILGAIIVYSLLQWYSAKMEPVDSGSPLGTHREYSLGLPSIPFQRSQWKVNGGSTAIPSPARFGFYAVLAVSWYLYTSEATKFAQLPMKIVDAIRGVLYTEATGSAANVVTKQYGSTIVTWSRLFYILIGLFMALGLAIAVYNRLGSGKRTVDDGFLSLGIGFGAILVSSALPSGTGFAVARVMMIVFTFSAPFALLGVDSVFSTLSAGVQRATGGESRRSVQTAAGICFTIVLLLFFSLNSGVAAETLHGDYSPSTKISQERLLDAEDPIDRSKATRCRDCNIETHVWMMQHRGANMTVFGDEFVESQTDFYQSALAPRVGFSPGPNYYRSVANANRTSISDGYVVLLSHNLDTGGVYPTKYTWEPLRENQMAQQNIVYSTGDTIIFSKGR